MVPEPKLLSFVLGNTPWHPARSRESFLRIVERSEEFEASQQMLTPRTERCGWHPPADFVTVQGRLASVLVSSSFYGIV